MQNIPLKAYRVLVALTVFVIAGGMVFYHFVEKLSWVDAYYFCVITLTTVGYGDITPKTTAGKLFTTVYLLIGIGIITAFITTTLKIRAQHMAEKRRTRKR